MIMLGLVYDQDHQKNYHQYAYHYPNTPTQQAIHPSVCIIHHNQSPFI